MSREINGVITAPVNVIAEVVQTGRQGPMGPAGPGAIPYIHDQQVAASVWIVVHNLGKRPHVTIVDTADRKCYGDVHYDSDNQITITLSAAFSGKAYVS